MRSKRNLSWIFFISTFICWSVPCILWASVQVDGIYYDLNTSAKTAAVAPNPDYYTGVIDIPSNFVYEGNTYNVTSIGYCAFLDCEGMTAVNMPNSVTTIENSAFERSTGLTELNIGAGVTTIKTESFKNCINLVSLTLPKSLKSIGPESFAGCSSLTKIIEERTTPPTIISTTFNGVDKSTCKVYVPAGCRSTYANASYWKSFSNIEERAVVATGSCGKSVTYTIYSDMSMVISGTGEMSDYMGETPHIDAAYYQKIESVVIEDGVTSIGEFAFYDFIRLTSLRIASSVTKIGNAAFYNCSGLTSLHIPNSVAEIGNGTFYLCSGLSSVDIPSSVTTLSYALFFGCTSLASVIIPESVTQIDDAAFEWCTSLTSVSVPASVESIGEGVFGSCTSLSSIMVDAANTIYDSRDNCNAIIETSTNTLIAGCMSTIIPASVTAIGGYSFYECTGLTSLTIGNGVTAIEDYAFANCRGLTSITVENKTPISISQKVFLNVDKVACTLYVPAGSKSAYESAEGWNEFEKIEETEGFIVGDANGDGKVRIGDATAVLNYLIGFVPDNFNEKAADANGDGKIRIGDATTILNIILNQ